MTPQITFTLDLEDHRPDDSHPIRYPHIVENLLEFWKSHNIQATVFTVGKLAQTNPDLIKAITHQGHEIACHSYDHTILTQQTPQQFEEHTKQAKAILEDITGEPVKGYRAPVFSLTPQTLWAVDILKELGFEYSSSILPTSNPLHGFPNAPQTPFYWHNGLLEIPAPIGRVGPKDMPYLGGFYFRYLPFRIIKKCVQNANTSAQWTYCHPYDFDADEKNWRIKGASSLVSLLLYFNRKNTFQKFEKLAQYFEFTLPFKEQNFENDLPVFNTTT